MGNNWSWFSQIFPLYTYEFYILSLSLSRRVSKEKKGTYFFNLAHESMEESVLFNLL